MSIAHRGPAAHRGRIAQHGAADEDVPPPLIGVTGGLFAVSLILFSVDALVLRTQAKRIYLESSNRTTRLTPLITPLVTQDGAAGAIAGLAGRF